MTEAKISRHHAFALLADFYAVQCSFPPVTHFQGVLWSEVIMLCEVQMAFDDSALILHASALL